MIKLIERRKGFRRWVLGEKYKIEVVCKTNLYKGIVTSFWELPEADIWSIGPTKDCGRDRYLVKALFELAKQGEK